MSIIVANTDLDGYMWADDIVTAVYSGDELVWPDVSGKHVVQVDWPKKGTENWIYLSRYVWSHARFPDNVSNGFAVSVDGVRYVADLEGAFIFFTAEQKAHLAGKIKESITCMVSFPSVKVVNTTIDENGEYSGLVGLLPLATTGLNDIEIRGTVSSLGGSGNLHVEVVGEPSKAVRYAFDVPIAEGDADVSWRIDTVWAYVYKNGEIAGKFTVTANYVDGDYGFSLQARGCEGCKATLEVVLLGESSKYMELPVRKGF